MKKSISFASKVGVLPHLSGMRYLEIPPRIIAFFGGTFKGRFICGLEGKVEFQGGLMALGKGKGYISITRKRLQQAGLEVGDLAKLTLKRDPNPLGVGIPEEFLEVLAQDDEGKRRFELLPPSKQRYMIHWIGAVKNPDLRIERALRLIGNLKRLPEGKEEFRQILGKTK